MKLSIILLFLAISSVKERDACKKSSRHAEGYYKMPNREDTIVLEDQPLKLIANNPPPIRVVVETPRSPDVHASKPTQTETSGNLEQKPEVIARDPTPAIIREEKSVDPFGKKLPWKTPLAKVLRAKPYDIKETNTNWCKDHAVLVPIPTELEEFPQQTSKLDNEVLALRTTWKVHQLVNTKEECEETITFGDYYKNLQNFHKMDEKWLAFFAKISNCRMYPEDSDAVVQSLLNDLSTLNIALVEHIDKKGTQIKLRLTFTNGLQAMFKPMRFDHDYESDPNQVYYNEIERSNAEIAAFHLDKLLGFRRAVPTVGREFSISKEFKEKTPPEHKKDMKYFGSPGKNLCMIGTCVQYCDTAHAICGEKGKIRGSVQAWLPRALFIAYEYSPYRRNYTLTGTAPWQGDDNSDYCDVDVKQRPQFMKGRRALDLVDLSVFDFVTGNQDRHGYEWFSQLDADTKDKEGSFIIPLDNGRAFGNPNFDDLEILAPLTQCCIVRPSTVYTLLNYYKGPVSLGKKLAESMDDVPLRPILAQKYFDAIDRRVEIVLQAVVSCLRNVGNVGEVLMNKLNPSLKQPSAARKRFTNHVVKAKRQGGPFNQPQHRVHMEEYAEAKMRQKRNIRDIHRPIANDTLVNMLNSKLEPFLEADEPCENEQTLEEYGGETFDKTNSWGAFNAEISNCHLYKKDSKVVEDLLTEMATSNILQVTGNSSSQFKRRLKFKDGSAIFKPMRFGRNYESNRNHFYFDDFERHNAEIAAFHLDRLLGFRRVLPTVGRQINVKTDLIDKMHPKTIMHFVSPAGSDCFYGGCGVYCDTKHAFCGNPYEIEGSVRVTLPALEGKPMPSPYRIIYDPKKYEILSTRINQKYCDILKKKDQYNSGRRLPDLIDLQIFDYLTGNQQREHFNLFTFPNQASEPYIYITDNGKAFGNPHDDDLTILAPLIQCCVVRPSTVKTLLDFYNGEVSLGRQLDDSLTKDQLYPILAEKYLTALNRRVEIVLQQVQICLEKAENNGGPNAVLMNSFQN